MGNSRIFAVVVLLLFSLGQIGTAQQQAASPADAAAQQPPDAPQTDDPQADDPQATFRAGINYVRVDVIVTDRRQNPITDLAKEDFELLEDGKPQPIEQFRLVEVDGRPRPGDPPPREVRTRDDELLEASREDVRIYGILLDDYHVRKTNAISVREPLIEFIRTQLNPNDLIAVMYPLTPVRDLLFTNDHAGVISAIERFEGRKYDYTPRNQFEEQYARASTQDVERVRNDVVMSALRALSVRMGSIREGRKSIIFVSEGFTALLPPQMQRADASLPSDPRQVAAGTGLQDSARQQTAEWFAQTDVYSRMRDVFEDANRNNASIYSLDPRGLTPFEFQIDDVLGAPPPSFATDGRVLQMTQDTLRVLAEETDGRAIVNRNSLAEGLAQIVRDSSVYYLIGYNSQVENDGKFHEIDVRVKRSGVEVRARPGFWAPTEADAIRAATPTPELAKPVQQALATLAANSALAGRYVRTWVGTERGDNGRTRVTLVWEPLPPPPGVRREQPGRVALLAASETGNLVFRGAAPEAAASAGAAAGPNDVGTPQRLVFDAQPGTLELRMTVQEAGTGGTLDQEIRTVEVPDFTGPQAAISTPRVYRGRTPRELQSYAADADAVATPAREFARTERLLIRFDAYAPGGEQPEVTAALLDRTGEKVADVPVAPATTGGTHQINMGLASVATGEYLIEITVRSASGEAKELVPFRIR